MIEGSVIELKMLKPILKGMKMDENVYTCRVETYEAQEEKLYIETDAETINKFQLDAKYRCTILSEDETITCDGSIKERIQDEEGNILLFWIERGFYKILSE
ncbi:MAG: hypothetical protein R3Y40_01825 [Eubacteriales bacterium]